MKRRLFGTQENSYFIWCPRGSQNIDPEILKNQKIQNVILCFVIHIGAVLAKNPLMFFGRYWSHIHNLGDFIKRFFGILRCPSFPKLTKSGSPDMQKNAFIYFRIFVE